MAKQWLLELRKELPTSIPRRLMILASLPAVLMLLICWVLAVLVLSLDVIIAFNKIFG